MSDDKIVYYAIIHKDHIIMDKKIDSNETIQARILLSRMLDYLHLEIKKIVIAANGKPYFKDSTIFFNYSHSKNYIACAISYYEVGIDIEETTRAINDDIAKKCLDGERDYKKRIEKWVKKEAYSKLKGLGLQINFQSVNLDNLQEQNYFIVENEYMCSIYCDGENMIFKKMSIIDC